MELTSSLPCQTERGRLWAALFNTEVWKESVPDAEKYELIGDNLYEMLINADLGPIKGAQTIKIQFSELQPPASCNFELQHSLVKTAKGNFELKNMSDVPLEAEDGQMLVVPAGTQTILNYTLNADTGNPLFNVVLDGFKDKIKQGFEELLTQLDTKASQSDAV